MNVLLFVTLSCIILTRSMARADTVDDKIQSAMQTLNIRGASVAFYDKNLLQQPVIRGYGKVGSSNNAQDINTDTAFMIASLSKVFAASAVSAAISQDLIGGLDDDICNVVPASWARSACRNPSHANVPVTWRMLVTHRSSIRENIPEVVDEFGDFYTASYGPTGAYQGNAVSTPSCPLTDVKGFYRDFFTNKPTETSVGAGFTVEGGENLNWYKVGQEEDGAWLSYKPGASNTYSNLAIGYIAALIELASGQSFEDFTQETLLEPLGMSRTSWFRSQLPSGIRETLPISYTNGKFVDEQHYCFIDYASGQLRTTANDMSTFLKAMLDYGAPTLWSDTIGRTLLECQEQDVNGNTLSPGTCDYGTGWSYYTNDAKGEEPWMKPLERYDWTNAGEHSGSEVGSQTEMIVLPEAGVYVVVLTNTDGNAGDLAAQELAKVLVDAVQTYPPAVTTPPSPPISPSANPLQRPSTAPLVTPSTAPSTSPSATPSKDQSTSPSATPSKTSLKPQSPSPSTAPSKIPSVAPTATPSAVPSVVPSAVPSAVPSTVPSAVPSTYLSVAPSTVPSEAPSEGPGGGFCFSGQSIVQVEHQGSVLMKDVKIGDRVLVNHEKYEEIYGFGHRHEIQEHNYLRLLPSGLEVSTNHMVFVQNRGAMPAVLLQIGDQLSGGAAISAIEIVPRRGVYAPFTLSGTIMVNNVLASTYIAFQGSEYLMVGIFKTPFRYQWLAHTFLIPRRLWSRWFGGHGEAYSEDGIALWLELPFKVTQWVLSQSPLVAAMILMPCLCLLTIIFAVKSLFGSSHLIAGVFGYIFIRRYKLSFTRSSKLHE